MSERDLLLLLEDMRDAARKILDYTKDMTFEDFLLDDKTIDAAVRNFEIIGEAARRVPANFKIGHPEIEWHRITGLRNRIIHEYFGVDYKTHICHKIQMVPSLFIGSVVHDFIIKKSPHGRDL